MRCFLSIGLRRFTGLGCFAHHAAGGRPGGCAMGTWGIGWACRETGCPVDRWRPTPLVRIGFGISSGSHSRSSLRV